MTITTFPSRVLPLDAPEMIRDSARVVSLERDYNAVPRKERAGLMALLRLLTRSHSNPQAFGSERLCAPPNGSGDSTLARS